MPESTIRSRIIGPLVIGFQASDPVAVARLGDFYAGFSPAGADEPVSHRIAIDFSDETSTWVGACDGLEVFRSAQLGLVEEAITRRINRLVLDAETDRLHLHAGAVERDGAVVLVVGPSGSGKSTLVAALVRDGWALLSDEQLGVLPDGRLVAFPRPVTLRKNSWPLFPHLSVDTETESLERLEVGPTQLGAIYSGGPLAPALIVRPDAATTESLVERMTVADTFSTLLTDTLDLERAGDAGLDALISLVSQSPGVRIAGTDLDATIAAIADQLRAADAPGAVAEVAVVAPSEAGIRSATSVAWLFADDSAALFDTEGGALVVVDGAGFDAWKVLGDPQATWPDGMAESEFVHQLSEVGLVVR